MKHAILFVFLLSVASSACNDQKEQPLSSAARKTVSQRYADSVRTLTPIVDSLCKVNQNALISELTDSIYKVRIADLERQRKRFQQ